MGIYVTENGFEKRRQPEIKTSLETKYKDIYGQDVQLSAESTNGQLIGTLSEALADIWDGLEVVYNSYLPGSVTGRTQEELYALNGLEKDQASASTVLLTITGTAGYTVTAGFQAATDSGLTFETTDPAEILPGGTVDTEALCTVTGPNEAPAGTITNIKTPQGLVTAVTNNAAALPGQSIESNALYRLRRTLSTGTPGSNLIESAFGQLSNLSGVQAVRIYQNRTRVEDITKPGLLANSWMPIVLGGDQDEIGKIIWLNTSAGIGSVGNTEVVVTDLYDFPQSIYFERPTLQDIYVNLSIKTDGEFPADGVEQIRKNIIDYASGELLSETNFAGFGIGEDVFIARLFTPINRVQGHNILSLEIAESGAGPFAAADIVIPFNVISAWSETNIAIVVS